MGERADAIPEAYPWLTVHEDGSMEADMEATVPAEADRRLIIMQELQAGRLAVASAPLLPGGDEAERLREALALVQRLVNIPPEAILNDTERVRRIKLVVDTALSARPDAERAPGGRWLCLVDHSGEHFASCIYEPPDAERAPQEDRCPTCGLLNPGPEHRANEPMLCAERPEPRPQGDEVETVADPDVDPCAVWGHWCARCGAALDARSGADTVKRIVEHVERLGYRAVARDIRHTFASGADRPEGKRS